MRRLMRRLVYLAFLHGAIRATMAVTLLHGLRVRS